MNGYECLQLSIQEFEKRLTSIETTKIPLSVAELAKISGYSLWHFTRLFTCVMKLTPKAYIQARVFTECSKMICSTTRPLSFISDIFGFKDYTTFSRAFHSWSGYTPAVIRKKGLDLIQNVLFNKPDFSVISANINKNISINSINIEENITEVSKQLGLNAELVQCKALSLTGLSFYLDEQLSDFTKLWNTFMSKEKGIICNLKDKVYCQYTAWNPSENGSNDENNLIVMCALVTDSITEQKPVFVTRTIPAGLFLHVIHSEDISSIGQTYEKIYNGFFANSQLKLSSGWEYQLYRDEITDIYIPVK